MSDALRNFIEAKVPTEGLAAWGAELANHTYTSQCYSNWFTPSQVEQTVKRLAIAAQNLAQHQIVPMRLCWTFEHARVLLALRDDGKCLTFFVENRSDLSQEALERALDEFLVLPMD
jgi:hypothetical protein